MGGLALSPSKYDMCTHICIEGESTCRGRIITKEWIMKCHDHNTLLELDETSSDAECSKLVSTTKKRRLMQGVRCSSNGRRTKRKLCFGDEEEDELYMQLHQLLLCKADNSEKMLNLCHVVDQMKTMVKTVVTPGSVKHETTSTLYKVKLLIKKIYNLIKSLHAAGYSLRGKFTSSNFVIDETNIEQYIRFAFLPKGVLQLWDSDGEELDMKGFEKMVRREIFKAEIVPHDINFWLSLIGEKELEGLLPWHVSLMSVPQCSESFTTWYDTFTNLENQEVYERIVKNLSQYNGWQKDIRGNGLLEETFDYCDPKTSKPVTYNDDVIDLLRLLRNSRQHSSKYRHDEFALIVGQIYPDLLADFQIELFKEGCIDQIN